MYIYYHSGNKIEQMKHYLHEEPSSVCGWDCRGKGVKTNTSRLKSLLLFLPGSQCRVPGKGDLELAGPRTSSGTLTVPAFLKHREW